MADFLDVAVICLLLFVLYDKTRVNETGIELDDRPPSKLVYVRSTNKYQCWDISKNDICDSTEDNNGDGNCNMLDCTVPKEKACRHDVDT